MFKKNECEKCGKKINGKYEFCPYCGTKMPKVKMRKRPPKKVYSDDDGGYYCGTCSNRNMECSCAPRTVLFEVVR